MPAVPVKPPARMLDGLNEAPKLIDSGPPFAKIAMATMISESNSITSNDPRIFAPISILKTDSSVAITHPISAQAHQDRVNQPLLYS
jgi:hypothetical protein